MGELAERVNQLKVFVSTPDNGMTAELQGRDQLSVTFQEGLYRRSDEAGLERKIATLANLLWLAHTREYWRIFRDVTGNYLAGSDHSQNSSVGERQQARDSVEAIGVSANGAIKLRSTGLRQWHVSIRGGTLRDLSERDFTASLGEAAQRLLRAHAVKLAKLSYQDRPSYSNTFRVEGA
ncbi:hypothetical protein [Kineosporia sp. NBRC 101731]|uniref:hypothetical protein n=1 Tax=Kineosporia sp. NBRC 101731 TaxID=3032199 RepID=UPI0024A21CA8|nr:hypothetical protein [Kineosporia sp. NBRC 101731]GLY32497.1 hypothetical protein Kisp02_58620 [Kineosporia sp. NBRC 101731]